MSDRPVLSRQQLDLACAIALGFVEDHRVAVQLEAVTLFDDSRQPVTAVRGWLDSDDPLRQLTRQYLLARRAAIQTTAYRPGQRAWDQAAATRTRDQANQQAREAREQARLLLVERGVFDHARQLGLRLVGVE